MVATAGVAAAARGVAAKTLRTGSFGTERADDDVVADRGEGELGDQGDADAGGDQPLDGRVVVGFEGDARLEAGDVAGADDVAGAGARRRGLDEGLLGEVGEPRRRLAPGQPVVGGQGQVERVVEQLEAAHPGRRAARRRPRIRRAGRGRTRRRAAAARSPPARPRPGSARPRGGRRGSRRSPPASGSPRRRGRRRCAGGRRGRRRSPPARARPPRSGRGCRRRGRRGRRRRRSGGRRRDCARSAPPRLRPRASRSPARPPTASRRGRRPPRRRSRARSPRGRR